MADIRKNGKQYGLICPKKAPLSAPKAINVFGGDDDTDEDDGTDWVKKALKAEGEKHRAKKQTRLNMQKALDEDPTIYQYDEVFDDMKQTEEQGKVKKKEVKKSKYIGNLLKTADRRKREQEHRIERMVQKEREAEGEMYADKESFVTSAYKAKLEELKKMEEEERNMDRLEAIGDVTKQPDISGFYRHLYEQTVDPAKASESDVPDRIKETPKNNDDPGTDVDKLNIDKDDVLPPSSASDGDSGSDNECRAKESTKMNSKGKRSRQYRQRVVEASESESEADESRDKDAGIAKEGMSKKDESLNESVEESKSKKTSPSVGKQQSDGDETVDEKPAEKSKPSRDDDTIVAVKEEKKIKTEKPADKVEEEETKNKVSIWEKRTVGPVFEAALQRYYIRKAARLSGS